MVVILIVQASNTDNNCGTLSPGFVSENSSYTTNGSAERSDTTTTATTTSVSFISSNSSSSPFQIDPDTVGVTKEEEWVTKKKVELTTKKQIETRVKRQVVLEDGKVVEDSGPIVTTNTTEDTEEQEHEQTEHRKLGDDEVDEGWIAVPGTDGIVKEVRENKTKTREEKEEKLETEDVQHLGDISDETYKKAVQSGKKDIRLALRQASSDELATANGLGGRVVHHSTKSRKTVDSEDSKHLTGVKEDGRLVTETTKTTQHEEIKDTEEPDEENCEEEEEEYETHQSSSQKFRKTKDQEFVEYIADGVKIGEEMRYEAENVEGDRTGNPENLKMEPVEWESLSERIRRMRREKQRQEELERMDALTKKPLNFDQEERTRKDETNKWLEHHFGSESRSSKSSLDDIDQPKSSKNTSFINITMKSAKNEAVDSSSRSQTKSYFKGVSEWDARGSPNERVIKPKIERATSLNNNLQKYHEKKDYLSSDERSYSPFRPIKEKLHSASNRYYHHERTSSPMSPPISELEASPLYNSVQQRLNSYEKSSSSNDASPEKFTSDVKIEKIHKIHRSESPPLEQRKQNGYFSEQSKAEENHYAKPIKKSNLVKRESTRGQRWTGRTTDGSDLEREEPYPDYSPRLRRKAPSTPDIRSTSPPPESSKVKKIYQKTRFSADIPLVKRERVVEKKPSTFGQTFRRLVGKFRSGSSERKKPSDKSSKQNGTPSYQSFSSVDSVPVGDHQRGRHSPQSKQVYERNRRTSSSPVNLRSYTNEIGTQTLDRSYQQHKQQQWSSKKNSDMRRQSSPAQKYYLGEDPFSGSIYGKEKEYDGVTPFRRRRKNGSSTDEERKGIIRNHVSGTNGVLGSRLSKSTSRLTSKNRSSDSIQRQGRPPVADANRGGVQTLPRKLRDEKSFRKQVYIQEPASDHEMHSRRRFRENGNSGSMINVSMVNNINSDGITTNTGPAKPARTYRTAVTRSKSFNVGLHPGYRPNERMIYKSNPQLHTLEESPPPLKSPGIVTSINRSTRDLSKSTDFDFSPSFKENWTDSKLVNGYTSDTGRTRVRPQGFKSSELYRTVKDEEPAGKVYTSTPLKSSRNKSVEYSDSFRSSPRKPTVTFDSSADKVPSPGPYNTYSISRRSPDKNGDIVNKTVTRQGNSDDYSETVRITSKSNDPMRPSVTNTVQSFSKKTVPSKDGRIEKIESSETTRVTKSHYRGDPEMYSSKNGGVVIGVKNGNK